jgi:hypothetical protein
MKWIEVETEDKQFVDLDTHVDIHKPDNTIVPIHVFNSKIECIGKKLDVLEGHCGDAYGFEGY